MLMPFKRGARFDYEKAKWVNQQHLATLSVEKLMKDYSGYFEELEMAVGTIKRSCRINQRKACNT